MAESKKVETIVYCLGPVGGQDNPVLTKGSAYDSKYDYTTKGYARYIEEASNVMRFQDLVINYFLESVKSEFQEDPLAFIDAETEEDSLASMQKMKKQWKDMFKEHQKKLRESLKEQKEAIEEQESEEGSSSSAKIPRLDPEAEKTEPASEESKISAKKIEFPESIFLRKAKEFAKVLKTEYQELRARMGKALDRITYDGTAHDLKGFTLQNMEKFAKWKYDLKAFGHFVVELESNLCELDLDLDEIKENENRVNHWMYFDDGEKDLKYHHRLLIPMDLTGSVSEISALVFKQIRRWKKISKELANKLPTESEVFEEKMEQWRAEVLGYSPKQLRVRISSNDTLFGAEDMPEET